jgi:hypothetical protein
MEEAVELEDPGFKLGPLSIEEIGLLSLKGYASAG